MSTEECGVGDDCDPIEEAPDAPVTRVILQDEVKLYRAHVVLAYLDSDVYDFGAAEIELGADPLPVYSDDHRKVGFASVELQKDEGSGNRRLVADLSIDYASEERLLAETQDIKLYPRVYGQLRFAAMTLFDFQAPLTPVKLRVDGIQLSRLRPYDPRIAPFGALVA